MQAQAVRSGTVSWSCEKHFTEVQWLTPVLSFHPLGTRVGSHPGKKILKMASLASIYSLALALVLAVMLHTRCAAPYGATYPQRWRVVKGHVCSKAAPSQYSQRNEVLRRPFVFRRTPWTITSHTVHWPEQYALLAVLWFSVWLYRQTSAFNVVLNHLSLSLSARKPPNWLIFEQPHGLK